MFDRIYTGANATRNMGRIKQIHFVGIGGVGMCGIAEVYANLGFSVSGSDLKQTATTRRLEDMGIRIAIGHAAENVQDADVVVISSAVGKENPEVREARELMIPVVRRAEMLAELMRFRFGIAVAGTHGKTTTTSLVSSLLAEGDLDPTFVIGGKLNSLGVNARLGEGSYLVAEADESDASFLHLQPMMTIVTNIDADHMSTYDGDFSKLRRTFIEFLHHLPFYGLAVMCIDDPQIADVLKEIARPVLTYGLSEEADLRASNIEQRGMQTHFTVSTRENPEWLQVTLNLPGTHNVQNALAAIAVANQLGVADKAILKALSSFEGIGRRFQVHGDIALPNGKVTLVDDYGHHPREVQATLDAINKVWPDRRIVVAFQPHRYSRTRDLFEDFVQVLSQPEVLLLLEVYAAGEEPVTGADSRSLMRAIRMRASNDPVFIETIQELKDLVPKVLQDNDVLLTLGAGDIGSVPGELFKTYSDEKEVALPANGGAREC
ncbi:MAG: UDP-N-acetylmuramate--L-alanine ligase [Gammaproteobacteria bacterium]|nr:UDP-N-acetylmuramate--L-alanine ligase [Gammaproteobacteria bacterium]